MEQSSGFDLVRDFTEGGNTAALAIGAGALLMIPIVRQRTAARWAAAAAGGILAYGGVVAITEASRRKGPGQSATSEHLEDSIFIASDPARITRLWRNPDSLTAVMEPFAQVSWDGPDRLRWRIPLPVGEAIGGEVVKVEDKPGELVHWRTSPGSPVQIDEWLRVRPARGRGNGADVTLAYRVDYAAMPGGEMLRALTDFLKAAPEMAIRKVLHNLKGLAEQDEYKDQGRIVTMQAR